MNHSRAVRVACLQMNSGDDVLSNLRFIEKQLSLEPSFDVLALPENFAQMPKHGDDQYIEFSGVDEASTVQRFLIDLAHRYDIHIVAGTLPIRAGFTRDAVNDKPYARCLIVAPEGIVSHYDKLHLFDVDVHGEDGQQRYRESDTYQPGSLSSTQTSPHVLRLGQNTVRLGASVCYDLRFPELYRGFAAKGVDVITVPSAFTYETGQAHWETLLRARAIENQSFVMAPAQVGFHANGRQTWGHSMIIDPWGRVLAVKETGAGLLYADLDLHLIDDLKHNFPVLAHQRLTT